MALTRKFLSALGIEADKVDEIINAHAETVDALKEQRDSYKADAEKVPALTKELEELKAEIKDDNSGELQKKYDDLKAEYDKYKDEVKAKETQESKSKAYKAILKEANVSEKRIDAILKITDLSTIELDKDGNIKNHDDVIKSVQDEYSEFIQTTGTKGANPATPPAGTGSKKTKEEILAIKDTAERQQAMLENKDLFI